MRSLVVAAVVLLSGCATPVAPGGGPDDPGAAVPALRHQPVVTPGYGPAAGPLNWPARNQAVAP